MEKLPFLLTFWRFNAIIVTWDFGGFMPELPQISARSTLGLANIMEVKMSKSDERNLNITINNQENHDDEVVLSLSTIFKKLKKYFTLWLVAAIVCLVLPFGYATVTTHVNKAKLEALISFSYSGIEKGLDPNGRKFDVNSVKNPAVIESALTNLGLDMTELEPLREGIEIKSIVPKNAVDRITVYSSILELNGNVNAAERILDTSYYPTRFTVSLDYNNTEFSTAEAVQVFNEILNSYQDYFYETYGYNESLGSAVTAIKYEDYDYSEAVDVFNNNIKSLRSYVKQLSDEDSTRFRSSVTGYTFDDLYEALKTIQGIDLDKISSYISINNVTKDKDESLAYYEYRIKSLSRTKTTLEEQLANITDSIASYEKDQVIIYGGTEQSTDTLVTQASAQYDKMINQKTNLVRDLTETKQSIEYYKERQEALKSKTTGNEEQCAKVEEMLKSVSTKVDEMITAVSDTSDDYYKNVTFKNAYNVLVPASDTAADRVGRIVSNAKLPLIALEALCIMALFCVAIIEAFKEDNAKRKAALGAKADAAENSDADDANDSEPASDNSNDSAKDTAPEQNNSGNKKKKK